MAGAATCSPLVPQPETRCKPEHNITATAIAIPTAMAEENQIELVGSLMMIMIMIMIIKAVIVVVVVVNHEEEEF